MIFVTGTKRSGTSMWMQILKAGGFTIIGEAFSANWENSIRAANPHGFWESSFRQGVFFATNPHPETGAFLRPDESRQHVVKVFVPGVVRSDFGYIHHVIATMRPWREYAASIRRLYAIEDAWLAGLEEGDARVERAQAKRPAYAPEVEWWFEQYDLVRDVATRRYPFHWVSYERVLSQPEVEIQRVFRWLGRGDVASAVEVVDQATRTQHHTPDPEDCGLDSETIAVMDALYDTCHRDLPLTPELVARLNATQAKMEAAHGPLSRDRMRE